MKKALADKFYVYDYVKIRYKQIEKENEKIKKENEDYLQIREYKEEIEQIKKSSTINFKDREMQIKQLEDKIRSESQPLKQFPSLNRANKNCIFNEEDFQKSEIKPGTAKDYYYWIKPLIDDYKYRELLTGILN